MPLKIHVIPGRELDDSLRETWRSIQHADPRVGSPYLCPEFTDAVAAVRDDVFVGLMEEAGQTVGFFPFQRQSDFWRTGGPVGGILCDCQAVIAKAEAEWTASELIRGCGLKLWDFDHLLAHQNAFEPHATVRAVSPTIDLSAGFEAYAAERKAIKSKRLDQALRMFRKMDRECGGARFELNSRDPAALRKVIEWKIAQCERTGVRVYFREPWTVELVERIAAIDTPTFAGALSVLYAGDDVAAAHFGMRSATVWHWWFPTYSHDFGTYSPGAQLLAKLAEHLGSPEAEGLPRVIDLGKGDDSYKPSFANGSVPLLEGSVSCGSVYGAARSGKRKSIAGLKASPIGTLARRVKRSLAGKPASTPENGSD